MEKIQDVKGLGGMLNGFRDLVKDDKKIVFVGSPGFCTPFALFLGYPVREKELVFLPGLDMNKARSITATEYGMELGGAASVQAGYLHFWEAWGERRWAGGRSVVNEEMET